MSVLVTGGAGFIGSVLGWSPETTDLGEIVESAWRWEADGPPLQHD